MMEIADFNVVEKPLYINEVNRKNSEVKLCLALKNLSHDRAIILENEYLRGRKFSNFRSYVQGKCKIMGFRARVVLKDGKIYCFRGTK